MGSGVAAGVGVVRRLDGRQTGGGHAGACGHGLTRDSEGLGVPGVAAGGVVAGWSVAVGGVVGGVVGGCVEG
ncbi:hypothetical protein [Nonomuraea sp. KM88]|uniref:hypothetical protein n=1 Tax=Nonomuraea sp. KM88 TaxID=3457427 RepID=UPI003FCEB410